MLQEWRGWRGSYKAIGVPHAGTQELDRFEGEGVQIRGEEKESSSPWRGGDQDVHHRVKQEAHGCTLGTLTLVETRGDGGVIAGEVSQSRMQGL